VDEAPVGTHKQAFAGLGLLGCVGRCQVVAHQNFFKQRLRAACFAGDRSRAVFLVGAHPRGRMCAQQKPLPPAQQAPRAQNRRRQCLAPFHQIGQRDVLTPLNARQQTEVGRGEQANVIGVLAVYALETFGDDQLHTCQLLGGGAVLARRALAVAPSSHQHRKGRLPERTAFDGVFVAATQSGVGKVAQGVVVMAHDVDRRDLIGRDIVAQRRCLFAGQGIARQLAANHGRVLAEVKNLPVHGVHGMVVVSVRHASPQSQSEK
jgi:hypothetical protein